MTAVLVWLDKVNTKVVEITHNQSLRLHPVVGSSFQHFKQSVIMSPGLCVTHFLFLDLSRSVEDGVKPTVLWLIRDGGNNAGFTRRLGKPTG